MKNRPFRFASLNSRPLFVDCLHQLTYKPKTFRPCQGLSLLGEVAWQSRDGEGWFREEPSQQLRQDRVLYDHPGGGQGQGLAVKTGIAVADAVFHKGELPGGKFPPIAGFVLGQG